MICDFIHCAINYVVVVVLIQVRIIAAKATISFIVTNGKETNIQKHFMDLMPGVLDVRIFHPILMCSISITSM